MKKALRLLTVAGVTLGALVFGGTAMAAYTTPRLEILNPSERPGAGGPVTIRVTAARADDATFRLVIYLPQGYTSSLVPADGMPQIGTVSGRIQVGAISPDAEAPFTGRILGDNTYTAQEYPQGAACTSGLGAPNIDAVYVLELTASGQTLRVPMYVTAITAGPEATFASGRMVACLPSPYIPPAQGGATLGAKLVAASLTFPGLLSNPATAGDYRWRAFWTPWTPGTATPNAAGTVETQAVDRLGVQLAITRARFARGFVSITGSLREGSRGRARAAVQIYLGRTARGVRRVRIVRTNARGVFTARIRWRARGPIFARARVAIPTATQDGCTARTNPAVNCIRTTTSGYTLFNNRRVRAR
jgi:hypothetical protein